MTFSRRRLKEVPVALLMGTALAAMAGCGPRKPALPPPTDDLPMPLVIARVNDNNRKMDFLLKGSGVSAVVRYVDEGSPSSLELTPLLLYQKPRDLFLRLNHTFEVAMEIGSNENEYWVWKRIGDPRYYWGEHANTQGSLAFDELDMPVHLRPDILLEVLGLEELPTETAGEKAVTFWVGSNYYELVFLEPDETGQLHLVKTIDIDRREPFLIRSIVLFNDGHPVVVARLSDYKKIEGSDVLAARKIHMRWLAEDSSATLEFLTMKRFDKDIPQYFVSPLQAGKEGLGEVLRVDEAE